MQQNNYASSSKNSKDNERLFVVQHHVMNFVANNVSNCGDTLWYVDLGALNHMNSHGKWFKEMKQLAKLGYVETSDDTTHPIDNVGDVPLSMQDGKVKCLTNVLHVPEITKNLVSVGQMVEQGLQVQFNASGCYVEDFNNKNRLIAKGKMIGRMFTLDVNVPKIKAAMFAQGRGVVADTDIRHKRIAHINLRRLKMM